MRLRRSVTHILATTDAVGGVWRYSLELCSAWAERGRRIMLAVLGPAPNETQRREAGAIPGLVLLHTGLGLDWTAPDAKSLDDSAERLADLARKHRVNSVHLHAPALVGSVDWHAPVVAVIHSCLLTWWQAMRSGPPPDEFFCRVQATSNGLRRADAVVAPSAAFAADVRHAYELGRAITVIHNGRQPIALPARVRAAGVFASGRLWDDAKNVAGLDAAAAGLDAPLSVAGAASPPGGSPVVLRHARYLGVLADAALAEHLAANTVFAGLSLYEPFGLAVLEAAQAGMALVLSDIPVLRELWSDAAIFVDARDSRSVRAGLRQALADPEPLAGRAAERAEAFRRDAMADATWRVHARASGACAA